MHWDKAAGPVADLAADTAVQEDIAVRVAADTGHLADRAAADTVDSVPLADSALLVDPAATYATLQINCFTLTTQLNDGTYSSAGTI